MFIKSLLNKSKPYVIKCLDCGNVITIVYDKKIYRQLKKDKPLCRKCIGKNLRKVEGYKKHG